MGKKKGNEIPITNYDRAQALLRISEFLKDLKGIRKVCDHDKKKHFCSKYHLEQDVIDHEFVEKYGRKDIEKISIFTDDQAVRVIPYKRGRIIEGKIPKYDLSPHLREGRYLTIEIDLMRNDGEIMSRIKKEINYWRQFHVNRPETRSKQISYSPWEVYDLHHKDGLNFLQIARKLSGCKGNPTYNNRLMKAYKRVDRAYKKALAMRKQVKKSIESVNL